MPTHQPASPPRAADHLTARVAGLVYLVVVLTGVFSLAYAPGRIFNGDFDSASILAQESLYRTSIVAELLCYTAFIILPLVLYKLLSPLDRRAGTLMVAFALVSVPMAFSNTSHHFDLLQLAGGLSDAYTEAERQREIVRSRAAYENGLLVVTIFWGLWLIPFGYLVFRCGFLPRIIGVILMLAGLGYVLDFLGRMLWPAYAETGISDWLRQLRKGELLITLWLLAFGARRWLITPPAWLARN